jgi:hypothetical protein
MANLLRTILILGALYGGIAQAADDTDSNFGQIKKIDLGDETKPAPNHLLLTMNLNKVKAGMLGQVIFYQFSKRVRLEFDAGGLPAGEYTMQLASSCTGRSWTELHRFKSTSAHVQTEKSLPKYSLGEAKPGFTLLMGKALALFRVQPRLMVDCKTIVAAKDDD